MIWTKDLDWRVFSTIQSDRSDRHGRWSQPSLSIKTHGCSLPAKSCHSTSRTAYFSQNTCMHLQSLRPLNICQICYRNLAIRTSIFISCIEWLMDVAYFKCHVLVSLLQWPLYYCVDLAVACLLSFSDAHCSECVKLPVEQFGSIAFCGSYMVRVPVFLCSNKKVESFIHIFTCCFAFVVKSVCYQNCIVTNV